MKYLGVLLLGALISASLHAELDKPIPTGELAVVSDRDRLSIAQGQAKYHFNEAHAFTFGIYQAGTEQTPAANNGLFMGYVLGF